MKVTTETNQNKEVWYRPGEFELPEGLIGFPCLHNVELLVNPEETPFMWLHSMGDEALSFVVVDPADVVPGYTIEISDEDALFLGLTDPNEAIVLTIVTVKPDDPAGATVNLLGPIVVNRSTLRGKQVVPLHNQGYMARHPLLLSESGYSQGKVLSC